MTVRPTTLKETAVQPLQHLAHGIGVLELSVNTPERVSGWDWVILTAASKAQSDIYEAQLADVRRRGLLPDATRVLVVQDPKGERIGSGGATLNALRELADQTGGSAGEQRVLLVHAGGDSKRVPWASVFGKCFIPFPVLADPDRPVPTLFDHILGVSAPVAARMPAGGLLCFAGDALPLFAAARLDMPEDGAVVVTSPVSLDVAARHGVIVADNDGRVTDLLQKPDVTELTAHGALVRGCAALLDTGIYAFCGGAYRALVQVAAGEPDLVQKMLKTGDECSLYEEIAAAFVPARHDWLSGQPLGPEILNGLRGFPLVHHESDGLMFVHMGSNAEVLDHLRQTWGGRMSRRILGECGPNVDTSAVVCAALIASESTVGRGSVVYGSRIGNGTHIGTRCVVLNVDAGNEAFAMPDNACLWQVPVTADGGNTAMLTACCGVDDNPKDDLKTATFANCRLDNWLSARGLSPDDLWTDGSERTLWKARLFPLDMDAPLAMAMWMLSANPSDSGMAASWRSARRMSFADLHAVVDARSVTTRQIALSAELVSRSIQRVVSGGLDRNLTSLGAQLGIEPPALADNESAAAGARPTSRLLRMRSDIARIRGDEAAAGQLACDAFTAVQQEVAEAVEGSTLPAVSGVEAGRRERAELPVRFDIAGGWSDTPPYCLERPAAVLNLAATLNGATPVGADVEALDEPQWHLTLGETGGEQLVIKSGEDLEGAAGLKDRFALLRHALILMGFGEGSTISQGVRVRTWAHVPRGSGLGTSSILGAALLTALQRLADRPDDVVAVSDLVLMLEQRMTTGGGWQDQIGGLVPGIKLVSSVPVQPIRLSVEPVPLLPSVVEELESRLVIAFTGIERLAKNVLQIVVGRYLQRDGRVLSAISDLVDLAHEGRKSFAMGDIDGVGQVMGEAWEVHQVLDPNCANVAVDAIFNELSDLCIGIKLAGAGGGGFLGAIAKDAEAAQRARARLAKLGTSGLDVYDWRLYQ